MVSKDIVDGLRRGFNKYLLLAKIYLNLNLPMTHIFTMQSSFKECLDIILVGVC